MSSASAALFWQGEPYCMPSWFSPGFSQFTCSFLLKKVNTISTLVSRICFVWFVLIVAISGVTWPTYLKNCGYEAFSRDPRTAKQTFNHYYFRRGVSWDGYVVRVNFNEDNPMSMAYHSANILVKMDQDDRIGVHGPDIGLSVSEHMLS